MTGDSWTIELPCTRAEAEAIARGDHDLPGSPVLMTSEPDPARPDDWRLDAYYDAPPDDAAIAALRRLAPSAAGREAAVAHLPPQDWVTLSQRNLEPVTAGRFHVHTAAHAHRLPPGRIGLTIEAGRAFGTGQHETTTGCLLALDALARVRRFRNILDLGTGTGILALAALKMWRGRVAASDIDPVSIAVTDENILANRERTGRGRGRIDSVVASGMAHVRLAARAPYDLVIANILAGPLIAMAPAVSASVAPGGMLILAGLLREQAGGVAAAYAMRGLRLVARHDVGEWPTLVLRKRRVTGARRGTAGRSRRR